MNYRLIAVSVIDGSTYDVAEFRDFADVISHAHAITRWDIHCFAVDIVEAIPRVLSTLITTGAKL